MNSAYDRWWEARKIFGELTNNTRSFVTKIYAYFGNTENIKKTGDADLKIQAQELIGLSILYIQQLTSEIHNNFKQIYNETESKLLDTFKINTENKISTKF